MEKYKIGFVYRITNPKGKIYIGSTINVNRRFNTYKKYKCKDQPKIYNSLIKYGVENHIFEVMWEGDIKEMYKYETLIGWGFDALEPHNLNLTLPKLGDIYECVSQEVKDKIGKANRGKQLSQETRLKIKLSKQNLSQETRLRMSLSAKGKTVTIQTREKMKLRQIGKIPRDETRQKMSSWQLGKILSEETKNKISSSHKGKIISQENIQKAALGHMKPILQFTLSGIFIKEWSSAKIAGLELNIDNSCITKCCKNKIQTSGNFKWKYKK